MRLQFFYIRDLCKFIELLVEQHPQEHVYNLGNEPVSIRQWVDLCYQAAGTAVPNYVQVEGVEQRQFFPFYDYEYELDTQSQQELLPELTPLDQGLRESFAWYENHHAELRAKPYMAYIDEHFEVEIYSRYLW